MTNILVLNYNRPEETLLCLNSIEKYAKFEHKVILLNNGISDIDRIIEYLKWKLIDKLIINRRNMGGGFGTVELFNNSDTDYSLFIECDCELAVELNQSHINQFVSSNDIYSCVDLTGGISGKNIYSGRSFFINTKFYNSIKKDVDGLYGGPGPFNHIRYLESFIQEYFKSNDLYVAHVSGLIKDNGKWSIREVGDGIYRHRTDTKQFYIDKIPTYKTLEYPPFNDSEWEKALKGQWIDGNIPEQWKPHSFEFWE
jgi:hypothetical protein